MYSVFVLLHRPSQTGSASRCCREGCKVGLKGFHFHVLADFSKEMRHPTIFVSGRKEYHGDGDGWLHYFSPLSWRQVLSLSQSVDIQVVLAVERRHLCSLEP